MYNVTDAINNGKSDWANMQKKKLLKESVNIQQPPILEVDRMGGSDIPASAPGQGTGGNTTDNLRTLIQSNIDVLSKTPQYQDFVKKNGMIMSKQEATYIINVIASLKSDEFIKDKGALYKQLDEFIGELNQKIEKQANVMAANINKFNEISDEAVKAHQSGLGSQFRSLPTVNTLDKFKEMMQFFNAGDFSAHILHYLLPLVDQNTFKVLEENCNIDEARQKIPAVLSPTMNDPGQRPEDRAETRGGGKPREAIDNNAANKAAVRKFYEWLSNDVVQGANEKTKLPRRSGMVESLTNVLKAIKEIEKENVKLEGLKYVKEKGEAAASRGKIGADVTNKARAAFNLANPKDKQAVDVATEDLINTVESQQPQDQPPVQDQQPQDKQVSQVTKKPEGDVTMTESESVAPRTKRGPGKIFDVYADTNENVESVQDNNKKKLHQINEGWEKYKQKKTPNKQKPDEFNLLMG